MIFLISCVVSFVKSSIGAVIIIILALLFLVALDEIKRWVRNRWIQKDKDMMARQKLRDIIVVARKKEGE
jgi:hypothetical protein